MSIFCPETISGGSLTASSHAELVLIDEKETGMFRTVRCAAGGLGTVR